MRTATSPSVELDVTSARASGREAISVSGATYRLNPGEARKLADELRLAAAFVDELAPMAALPPVAVFVEAPIPRSMLDDLAGHRELFRR